MRSLILAPRTLFAVGDQGAHVELSKFIQRFFSFALSPTVRAKVLLVLRNWLGRDLKMRMSKLTILVMLGVLQYTPLAALAAGKATVNSQSAQAPVWQPSPGHTQVPIWPGAAPDALPARGPESFTKNDG